MIKSFKMLIIFFSTFILSNIANADLIEIMDSQEGVVYYDNKTISKKNNLITFTGVIDLWEVKNNALSWKFRCMTDCNKNLIKYLTFQTFSDNMSEGKLIEDLKINNWQNVNSLKGSVVHKIVLFICDKYND